VVRDGPPYPDRIHQSVLIFDLVDRLTSAVVEWTDVAEARVASWSSLTPDPATRADAMRLVADIRDRAIALIASHPPTADGCAPSRPAPLQARQTAAV
jgi:hypothetical protein